MKREPGWYKDPYFRNQERYWDGDVWSQETRKPAAIDTGAPDIAKPSAAAPNTEGTESPSAGPASAPADTASAMLGAPVPAPPTKETPATATPTKGGGSKQKPGPLPSTSRSGSSGTGVDAGDATRPVPLGTIIAPDPPTTKPGQGTPGGRRGLLIAFVVVLVLVFAGVGFYLTRGNGGAEGASGGSGSGATASQSGVTAAVQKTLQHGTADATVDVTVSTAKGSAPQKILSGTGGFDLKNETGTMSLTVPGSPASDSATQIVFVGPSVYVNLGSRLSSLIPGKTWITATAAQVGSSGSGLGPGISSFEQLLGNPATLVQQLNTSSARLHLARLLDLRRRAGPALLGQDLTGAADHDDRTHRVVDGRDGRRTHGRRPLRLVEGTREGHRDPGHRQLQWSELQRVDHHHVLPLRASRRRHSTTSSGDRHPGAVRGSRRSDGPRIRSGRPRDQSESHTLSQERGSRAHPEQLERNALSLRVRRRRFLAERQCDRV